jgi:ubiquinone/menaquinone biosynthesis C-methylase UbiE
VYVSATAKAVSLDLDASLRSGAAGASNGTGSVVGLDASLGMLEVARAKVGCRVKCLWF